MKNPSRREKLEKFQKIIGVEWKNIELLNQALTHSSYAKPLNLEEVRDNERMEFLGDAVLELVVADYLFRKYSHLNEGELSRLRSALVSEDNLARHARKLKIGDYLLVGKDQEEIRSQDTVLADTYEAIIGALYLDRGLRIVRKFIMNLFLEEGELLIRTRDFKSLLQEYTQSVYRKLPRYEVIEEKGPDHKKMFRVKVKINGKVVGVGWGPSKKKAEKVAAERAFRKIKGKIKDEGKNVSSNN